MKIHLAILEARQARHISQIQLGERTGLSPTYISKVENCCIVPTIDTLVRVANGLNMEPGRLLDRALDPSLDDSCVSRREVIMRNGSKRVMPVRQSRRTRPLTCAFPAGGCVRDPVAIAARKRLGRLIVGGEEHASSVHPVCV